MIRLSRMRSSFHPAALLVATAWLLAAPLTSPAGATDGASTDDGETYYEEELGGASTQGWTDLASPLPSRLHVADGAAQVRYRRLPGPPGVWEVAVDGFARRHERVAAVYDMILVLPLPEDGHGGDGFAARERGVRLGEGAPEHGVSLVYGGEKLRLKRNVALEKTWVAALVGPDPGMLPSLSGTGYRYTAWDTIVTRDPQHGDTLQGWARLRYEAGPGVAAPDPDDPRLAAWWITWIPSLRSEVAPYAVRMDVVPDAP